ncbi:uncharacterized protein [Malus domestica]|uniref:uncharacterized protein n=1 Tax=Malus domestica TaxID=3750 RepID=UPI0039763311
MELIESDLLDKTYSTFNAINIVLQQRYRAYKFTKFSDLISVLLFIEKQNQLLMKNHQAQSTVSNATLEAHATNSSSHKRRKNSHGHGNGQQAPPQAQGQQNAAPKGGNMTQQRPSLAYKASNFKNKGKDLVQPAYTELDMCYHCGSKDHWSYVYQASPKAIAKYHSRRESNFAHVDHQKDATTSIEILDF